MKKIYLITILFIALNILPAHGFDNEWEGSCYIEYNDKIYTTYFIRARIILSVYISYALTH